MNRLHPIDAIDRAIPDGGRRLAERIAEAGGRAYLVGGSLRDLLVGGTAKDWDFATDLPPERIRALFPRSVDVGARFGTILVVDRTITYEVTTLREEGLYSDARHPDSVTFTASVESDLRRRDFTINAMAYDPIDRTIVDPHGGRRDLEAGIVRCVGRAEDRYREDALRMLRCVRIAGQLDFEIEEETYRALVRCAPMLDRIAKERIREELDRILVQPRPSIALERLFETGLLERFLPELADCYGVGQNRFHAFDVFYHSLHAIDQAPRENRVVRLAALFHDLGKVDTRREDGDAVTFYNHQSWSARKGDAILRRLRYPNEERERVVHLIRQHMFHYNEEWTDAAIRRFIRGVGPDHLADLFRMRRADTLGNGLRRTAHSPEIDELAERIEEVMARENAFSVRDLAIDGHDLMTELGMREGPAIGRILDSLLDEVLEDPERNERSALLRRAEELRPEAEAAFPRRRRNEGG
ncbi:MAG: HDIG domain-containing protein [Candidatus Eisenbacteria bacterium]|nr:HDIG domain-containing protein [Candidatus Latescibacterota bacterium]MBD3301612.1 HDIG domain-containing protein [Candidatus Eisenbacteria bacterium]